jgi:hypothetical protein
MVFRRLACSLLAVAAVTLASGCVRRASVGARMRSSVRINVRQERQLLRQASLDLGCPVHQIVATRLHDRVYQVVGCGQVRDYAWDVASRRGGWFPLEPVSLRATDDMACLPGQLQITAPAPTVRDVVGCGRTARYELDCEGMQCRWVMTAPSGAWGDRIAGAAGTAGFATAAEQAYPSAGVPPPGFAAAGGVGPEASARPIVFASATDDVVIPEPPAPGSPEELVRAALDARREGIHRCAGVGPIAIRAEWSADGGVTIGLAGPLAGSPAEGCIRDVVGLQRVPPSGAPGQIVHTVL